MIKDRVVGGIMGVVTGDALGLPVQCLSRSEVRQNPVTQMRGGGAFGIPLGTWSDDSSLSLCLVESLVNKGYDIHDIADRFVQWFREGYCTPFGYSFDIGYGTRVAMSRLIRGGDPLKAGPADEHNNGNGSLMRILPAAIYFSRLPDLDLIDKICEVSKITHGHPRSQLGCALYALLVKDLLTGKTTNEAYISIGAKTNLFIGSELENELRYYERLIEGTIPLLTENQIQSTGYVVDTLEAAVWCLLTATSYRETLLKAVNLGQDTDSVGAVVGGIAGIHYGYNGIPKEWISKIIKKDWIHNLACKFASVLEDQEARFNN